MHTCTAADCYCACGTGKALDGDVQEIVQSHGQRKHHSSILLHNTLNTGPLCKRTVMSSQMRKMTRKISMRAKWPKKIKMATTYNFTVLQFLLLQIMLKW